MADVFVTVDYFGAARGESHPPCEGCTPAGDFAPNDNHLQANPSVMKVIGSSGGMHLCTRCARDTIKSIAARFMLHDPRSTRDLMSFFAVESAAAKPPRPRRPAAKKLAAPDNSVDVLPAGAAPKSAKKVTP